MEVYPPVGFIAVEPGSEEWKRVRARLNLTGSELAAAIGLAGAYNSRKHTWEVHCRGKTVVHSDFVLALFAEGNAGEPVARAEFEALTGFKTYVTSGIFARELGPERMLLGGTPDAFLEGTHTGVEFKVVTRHSLRYCATLPPRRHHILQCYAYMYVTAGKSWYLHYHSDVATKTYLIEWNDDFWYNVLIKLGGYAEAIIYGTPPKRLAKLWAPDMLVWDLFERVHVEAV
jgi:predicted phage-related endonuclease